MRREEQSWFRKNFSNGGEEYDQDEDAILKTLDKLTKNRVATLIIKMIEMEERVKWKKG